MSNDILEQQETHTIEARKALDDEEARRDEIHRRILEGDSKVTSRQLAEAESRVRHAEVVLEAAGVRDAEAHEQARQRVARDLATSLRSGELATAAKTILTLRGQMQAAAQALVVEAQKYADELRAAGRTVRTLQGERQGVRHTPIAGVAAVSEVGEGDVGVEVDGVPLAADREFVLRVVLEPIAGVLRAANIPRWSKVVNEPSGWSHEDRSPAASMARVIESSRPAS